MDVISLIIVDPSPIPVGTSFSASCLEIPSDNAASQLALLSRSARKARLIAFPRTHNNPEIQDQHLEMQEKRITNTLPCQGHIER
ncbi:MAG TPA: hypothetical protein VFB60_29235 [Ktedonobacteraceae bacterium]|nr:hypothetical protein [Ktedonobacteraceae bacterium]